MKPGGTHGDCCADDMNNNPQNPHRWGSTRCPSIVTRRKFGANRTVDYVPDGLTPAQYEARKKKEADKRKAKESFWSVKRTKPVEDLTSFQAERAAKFSNKQISEGLGRKYVKEKYKGDTGSRKPSWRGAKDPKEVGGLMKNFNLDLSFINFSGKPPSVDAKKKGKK